MTRSRKKSAPPKSSREPAAGSALPTNIGRPPSSRTRARRLRRAFRRPAAPQGAARIYRADFVGAAQTIAPGALLETTSRVFAGAKETGNARQISGRSRHREIRSADRLGLVLLHHQADVPAAAFSLHAHRQFCVAILIITVIVKGVFFPLANKSYMSMAKMRRSRRRSPRCGKNIPTTR